MRRAPSACASLLAACGLVGATCGAAAQTSLVGGAEIARVEYRIRAAGHVDASSGPVFGGALGLRLGKRFVLWGEALGGHLTPAPQSPDGEARDLAEVRLLGGAQLSPWLTLQAGASVRAYSTPLARQRWTTLRLGAEAHVPLALEGVYGLVRGQWMPVVSISGVPRPDVAFAAAAGLEWRRSRVSLGALYSLERYDFPASATTGRLEELASLQLRATLGIK